MVCELKIGLIVRWKDCELHHEILPVKVYSVSFHSGRIILLTHSNGVLRHRRDSVSGRESVC
jgi:hypothetical protein